MKLVGAILLLVSLTAGAFEQPVLGHYYLHKAMRGEKELPLDQWMFGVVEAVSVESSLARKEGRTPGLCIPNEADTSKLAAVMWPMVDQYLAYFRTRTGAEWPRDTPLSAIVLSTLRWKFPCQSAPKKAG